jgi:uncharacterized protein (TIGR00730 family)
MKLSSICVFCGANPGSRPLYLETARHLGVTLAQRGIDLVYGGSNIGLMHELAEAALGAGGRVIGVIPRLLVEREQAHRGLTELHVVDSMHQRKALMEQRADAFIALPGGLGTLDEMFEMLSWSQLGLHAKPCGLLNVNGYYDKLVAFLDHATQEAFLRPQFRARALVEDNVEKLLGRFESS